MKKLYIILGLLNDINGGVIYTANKAKYMEDLGYDVQVIDLRTDNIILDSLKKYKNNAVSFKFLMPCLFTKRQREKCLDELIKISGWNQSYDETIIESSYGRCSLWGELLAKRLNAKHMFFEFTADISQYSRLDILYDYFWFKHKRKEFVAISDEVYKRIFKGYKELSENECQSVNFYCTNSLQDIEPPFLIDKTKYDYVLGTVGRTNKNSFKPTIDAYAKFIQKYPENKYAVLIVGSEADSNMEEALISISSFDNVDIYRTGVIYPIPKRLIEQMDICVASHGSTKISAAVGIKTIAVRDETAIPYGVVGYTIKSYPFSDYSIDGTIFDIVEDILAKKKYDNAEYINLYKEEITDLNYWFSPHIECINHSDQGKEYYPTEKVSAYNIKYYVQKSINLCFGPVVLRKVQKLYIKHKRR